jgi:hypothetical protein
MRALTLCIACAFVLCCAPPASAAQRPPHFWHTAAQAVAIADKQPAVRRLAAHDPSLRGQAHVADLGLWLVTYRDAHGIKARLQVEDRTGDVLEQSPYAYPRTGGRLGSATVKAEVIALALTIVLLGFFFDFRRPLRWRNTDLLALLSLGAAVATRLSPCRLCTRRSCTSGRGSPGSASAGPPAVRRCARGRAIVCC